MGWKNNRNDFEVEGLAMEDDPWVETNSSPKEVEYFIHTIHNDDDDIFYGLHSIGRSYANHFSEIKLKYKRLALTWLSSLLIGLFFITESGDGSSLKYLDANKLYIDWMLTTLALLGVKLLSFLDVKVYHPQLGAIFSEQLALEKACPNLEKEYSGMARLLHSKYFDPVISDSLYYSIIMIIIAFLGVFSL